MRPPVKKRTRSSQSLASLHAHCSRIMSAAATSSKFGATTHAKFGFQCKQKGSCLQLRTKLSLVIGCAELCHWLCEVGRPGTPAVNDADDSLHLGKSFALGRRAGTGDDLAARALSQHQGSHADAAESAAVPAECQRHGERDVECLTDCVT